MKMELILFGVYVFFGAMANSFLKHNLLHIQTAYVFSMSNFITEKIILACLLGWITIPVAMIMRIFGVGKSV